MGNSRKYPYYTTDGFHILTPPCLRNFQNALSPQLPAGFTNMPNLASFTENYFKWLYFCSVQLVIEGALWLRKFWNENFKKIKSFLLTTVQQMQPTLTLHCPKLVQNIKITISCDARVDTRKILRLSVFSFPPSWIWAIGVSHRSQSHELQKWHPQSKRPCFALNGQNNLWGGFDERKKKERCLMDHFLNLREVQNPAGAP